MRWQLKKYFVLFVFISLNFFTIDAMAESQLRKEGSEYIVEDYSKTYTIDKIYKSMKGPSEHKKFVPFDPTKPELLWITSGHIQVVDPETLTPLPSEYLCHGNFMLNLDSPLRKIRSFVNTINRQEKLNSRTPLFSLLQGQEKIRVPNGFGVPVMSNESFGTVTQALNLLERDKPVELKIKMSYTFLRDSEVSGKIRPLFRHAITLYVPTVNPSSETEKHDCDGPLFVTADIRKAVRNEESGQHYSRHWVVSPGRHVYRYKLDNGIGIPYDTTAHFISVHLHAYGQNIELMDLTAKKSVFKSNATNSKGNPQIMNLQYYSSKKGIRLYKDHDYELISEYNNTSDQDIDAMAYMYFYLLDKEFDKDLFVKKGRSLTSSESSHSAE